MPAWAKAKGETWRTTGCKEPALRPESLLLGFALERDGNVRVAHTMKSSHQWKAIWMRWLAHVRFRIALIGFALKSEGEGAIPARNMVWRGVGAAGHHEQSTCK
jgi:hypothetical protein